MDPWWVLISLPPESLVVDAFVVEVVVLEIQLSEVSQVVKGPRWDLLQFVTLFKKKKVQSLCCCFFAIFMNEKKHQPANIWTANLTGA